MAPAKALITVLATTQPNAVAETGNETPRFGEFASVGSSGSTLRNGGPK
jgi:hypothetical protein